jgi:hypothetical protein
MGLFSKLLNKDADTKPKEDAAKMKETLDNFDKLAWDSFLENETKFRHQEAQVKRPSSDDPIYLLSLFPNRNQKQIRHVTQ